MVWQGLSRFDSERSSDSDEQKIHWDGPRGRVATVSDRLMAFFLDALLLSPLASLLVAPLTGWIKQLSQFADWESGSLASMVGSWVVLWLILFVLLQAHFLALWGATPGKWILRLRVVPLDATRAFLSPNQCLLRTSLWLLSILALGIPFLEVLSHRRRRAIYDRAADCEVVSLKWVEQDSVPSPVEANAVKPVLALATFVGFLLLLWGTLSLLYQARPKLLQAMGETLTSTESERAQVCKSWLAANSLEDADDFERVDHLIAAQRLGVGSPDCLQLESASLVLRASPELQAWGYLGRLVLDPVRQNEYASQICEIATGSEACKVADEILTMQFEAMRAPSHGSFSKKTPLQLSKYELPRTQIAGEIKSPFRPRTGLEVPQSLTALTVLIDRRLSENQIEGLDIYLNRLAPQVLFSSFVLSRRAELIWRRGESQGAEAVWSAASGMRSSMDTRQVGRWLCEFQLRRECRNQNLSVCQDFLTEMKKTKDWSDAEILTASLYGSCTGRGVAIPTVRAADRKDLWWVWQSLSLRSPHSEYGQSSQGIPTARMQMMLRQLARSEQSSATVTRFAAWELVSLSSDKEDFDLALRAHARVVSPESFEHSQLLGYAVERSRLKKLSWQPPEIDKQSERFRGPASEKDPWGDLSEGGQP